MQAKYMIYKFCVCVGSSCDMGKAVALWEFFGLRRPVDWCIGISRFIQSSKIVLKFFKGEV